MRLALALGLGAGGLGFLERLLDGLGALLHLRHEGLVEELPENEEQDEEVDHLDEEGLVQVDQAALPPSGERGRDQQEDGEADEPERATHGGGSANATL